MKLDKDLPSNKIQNLCNRGLDFNVHQKGKWFRRGGGHTAYLFGLRSAEENSSGAFQLLVYATCGFGN
jgi:hypothetical protein